MRADEAIKSRIINRVNLFKEPLHDEASAVWTDTLLTLLFPVVLGLLVLAMAISEVTNNPFAYVNQQLSTAGANLPYPPYGLSTPITCRVPSGCLAISYFAPGPPDRSSVCFQRMVALRNNRCAEDNSCTAECPNGNCCYDQKTNPEGAFLCDNWIFMPYKKSLNIDWCFSPRVNEGVFVFWGRFGGMGLDDTNKYEGINYLNKSSIKCEYIKEKGSYLNTFLTTACPEINKSGKAEMKSDYSEPECEKICTVKALKSGDTLYGEGVSFTNYITASDPDHSTIAPTLSKSLYEDRVKSQVGYTCKNLMSKDF